MSQKEKNDENMCKITENGIVCETKLENRSEIIQRYEAPPDFIDVVERDFRENIVAPKVIEQQRKGNVFRRVEGWFREKPVKCRRHYEFKNEGNVRVLKESGVCEEEEERWKKSLKEIKKDILELI